MSSCEHTANRSNGNNQDSWQRCGGRRRRRKANTLLCLCAEIAAITLTGCTQQFRVECKPGISVVSDRAIASSATSTKIKNSKNQTITGAIDFDYELDDLLDQMNGAQTQLSCEYGDAAKWPRDVKNELKFSLKPHLDYPVY